jgi:hypothetical protein
MISTDFGYHVYAFWFVIWAYLVKIIPESCGAHKIIYLRVVIPDNMDQANT